MLSRRPRRAAARTAPHLDQADSACGLLDRHHQPEAARTPSVCMTHRRQNVTFAKRLAKKQILLAPGIYDALSALIAEQTGFEAVYRSEERRVGKECA